MARELIFVTYLECFYFIFFIHDHTQKVCYYEDKCSLPVNETAYKTHNVTVYIAE